MDITTVVILIDALGFDLTVRHGFHLDGLTNRIRLETVLGFSQAALTSLFTGTTPDRHGLWMMYAFDLAGSPFKWLRLVPRSVSSKRRWLRRIINWKLEKVHGVRSYYSLYNIPRKILQYLDLPARKDIFAPGGVEGMRTVFDELETREIHCLIRDYRTPEASAFDELEDAIQRNGAGFYLLYTAGLDSDLHRYGSGHKRVAAHLKWYEERINRIIATAAGRGGEVRFFVLGDHGMCDVSSHLDVISRVEALNLSIPDDYIPFYDSTMARFRVFTDRAMESIEDLLHGIPSGHVLEAVEMKKLGLETPGGRFGDIIFLLNPGEIILPSYMSDEPVAGMHGYHPGAPGMYSVVFTNTEIEGEERCIVDMSEILVPGFKVLGEGDGS